MRRWPSRSSVASAAIGALLIQAACCGEAADGGDGAPALPDAVARRGPYDGMGRYQMDRDDGLRGIQGLVELAGRFGVKPYRQLQTRPYDGTWQSERLIFRDLATGAVLVRLTNDPWAETLSYFKGNWSADGQYIVFRRHPGMWENSTATHGPMVVRGDGTALRNVFRQYPSIREHVCSPVEPNVCFAMADGNKLVRCDLRAGVAQRPIREGLGCWRLKISPDGRYLMGRSNLSDGRLGLWIVSTDGAERHEIPLPDAIHDSYQFHPSEKKVMFWYEGRFGTEGFVQCDFDGRQMTRVPVQFDWNHGDMSRDLGVHTNGFVTRIAGDTWSPLEPLFARPSVEYYDDPCHYNGYLTWMPKDRPWVYATRMPDRPYLAELQSFPAAIASDGAVNRFRICCTGHRRGNLLDNPDASPDGTKVLFNSNMLGRLNIYYAVVRLPDRPSGLTAVRTQEGIVLSWQPPAHHAEIAGYHVYRSATSGVGFTQATHRPIAGTRVLDRYPSAGGATCYAVTAVDHSGLESGLSDEIAIEAGDTTRRTVFVEAETAERDPKLWTGFDGAASDLHYLWMRDRRGEGRARVAVEVPPARGPWRAWARLKGDSRADFTVTVGRKSVTAAAPLARDWTWTEFTGTLDLPSGKCQLELTSNRYGSAIDCLALSNDEQFAPSERPRVRWPRLPAVLGLRGEAASAYSVRLMWQPTVAASLHHYNLYCSERPDQAPRQRDLVASPDRAAVLDWGLSPGRTVYYRVTCVDRAGNESAPSASVQVALPALRRVAIEEPPAGVIEFTAPVAGEYVLWLRLKHRPGGDPYVAATMDHGPAATWTCAFDGLSDDSWFTYDPWSRFWLTVGRHRLVIDNRTRHALDAVLLTNDLSYRPEGHVNINAGW
ncbi:MAG: fibronectin type III domain-containing protein [Thermoguttaceae bacterium]